MSPRKYPQLTAAEVRKILASSGFSKKKQTGSHEFWESVIGRQRRVVTVDDNASPFSPFILCSMIEQSGLTREQFYGATKSTAKKIGIRTPARTDAPSEPPAGPETEPDL